ncbi:MAG: type I methionyl aminopeptidase [Candidatus Omnitrophica bacterium]|nr:type I methionyl aminopeptidase [Candidatus Omnitrophota bacterium]MBU4303911.1 type I methionyl aminopeptidase [Candidatus Omnitrophota bacterium]MBU4418720.1 type I methionyl aminopeptidase [Candidatus Omnitrophota bacterium]MBU4468088.1 type I methionyl aminopeptidase [Candidatus Omnitrophota bacterium]MCG2707863.1 type I methionyl aminopeptidase [Candidatus Omnitrophota bacterium]
MIPLKSQKDLTMLKRSGVILASVMQKLQAALRPGMTTLDIDLLSAELIRKEKALAAFKGYKGFPGTACVSVNEEIVHGIPGSRVILEGDIVSIDLGVNYEGFFSDMAVTLPVGKVDADRLKLIAVAKQSLAIGIKQAQVGNYLTDISHSIQSFVEAQGFSVVRQFVGHGIGVALHEEPEIPNFGRPGLGPFLKSGMVLAIEPMINLGSWECEVMANGWTAVTADGTPSAHFEHTVAVTDKGPVILTKLN